MAASVDHDQRRPRDMSVKLVRTVRRDDRILLPGDDQGRHVDEPEIGEPVGPVDDGVLLASVGIEPKIHGTAQDRVSHLGVHPARVQATDVLATLRRPLHALGFGKRDQRLPTCRAFRVFRSRRGRDQDQAGQTPPQLRQEIEKDVATHRPGHRVKALGQLGQNDRAHRLDRRFAVMARRDDDLTSVLEVPGLLGPGSMIRLKAGNKDGRKTHADQRLPSGCRAGMAVAWWQVSAWPSPSTILGGVSCAQIAVAKGHRVRKWQPVGRSMGLGSSPVTAGVRFGSGLRGRGSARIRAWV